MKTLIVIFALSMLALGCTETIYEEVIKLDTVYVDKPRTSLVQTIHVDTVYKELIRVDTVEVQVIVHDTVVLVNNVETIRVDTVVQIKTDSVFIERVVEKIVNHYDTVVVTQVITDVDTVFIDKIVTVHDTVETIEYQTEVIYLSVQYIYLFPGQSATYIPEPFQGIFKSFWDDAASYERPISGGDLIVQQVDPDELPGEFWTSSSWELAGDQWVIFLSNQVPVEQTYSLIYREMARIQLKKKYTNIPDRIMNPLFLPTTLRTTDSQAKKKPYLDTLFQ